MIFVSRPPGWVYLLLLPGVLHFVVVASATRKTLYAAGWPLCSRCRRRQRRLWLTAAALFLFGMAIMLASGSLAPGRDPSWGLLVIPGDLLGTFGPMVALFRRPPAVVARSQVTQGGQSLRLRKVAPAFAAALPAGPTPVLRRW